MLTAAEVQGIAERLKMAAPVPWLCDATRPHSVFDCDGEFIGGVVRNCDAERVPFIANAPTDIAALLRDREELVGLLREVASEAEWDGDGGTYTTDHVVSRGAELCGEETYRLCRRVLAAIGGTE